MKRTQTLLLAIAVAMYGAPMFAQHGHAGGMGAGANAMDGSGHGASTHNASLTTAHGTTMNEILTKNTALSGKIQKLTGMTAQQACSGFKNLGQCVAAAHVSKNLGLNFACLKADMNGVPAPSGSGCSTSASTGSKSMSLGQAIHALNPTANSKTESQKASKQAHQDINNTNS
jgi:hypothetical protein